MTLQIKNRRALHEYHVIQKFEAGIALMGSEIKSIRAGKVNFKDSYARIIDGECWLLNLHISPFEKSTHIAPGPTRKRRLPLHKHEIRRLRAKTEEQGMTIVPLEIFINAQGRCKLTIALVKGKKFYDKRDALHQKDLERDRAREE
ncbi:MAG: SsrA-binding protein SmpB [Candidatus Cloacimonetes bacterium]|nr:SsrA-binding protein SmpB [Candidatus Cloacimonadota bacterium]